MTKSAKSHCDPVAALHAALLASDLGISGAARLIGRSPGALHNKFCDSFLHAELSAREAIALSHAVGSTAFAEAVAVEFGGVFMPLPAPLTGEDELLEAYLDIVSRMGDLSAEFVSARADGVIDRDEFASLRMRGHRTAAAIMRLLSELEALVREAPQQARPRLAATGAGTGRKG